MARGSGTLVKDCIDEFVVGKDVYFKRAIKKVNSNSEPIMYHYRAKLNGSRQKYFVTQIKKCEYERRLRDKKKEEDRRKSISDKFENI